MRNFFRRTPETAPALESTAKPAGALAVTKVVPKPATTGPVTHVNALDELVAQAGPGATYERERNEDGVVTIRIRYAAGDVLAASGPTTPAVLVALARKVAAFRSIGHD